MKRRIFVMFLTICVTLSFLIVPANAADSNLHMVDILPAFEYVKFVDDLPLAKGFEQPHNWTVDALTVGWSWNTEIYDDTFSSIVFNLYINGNIQIPDVVKITYYEGRTVNANFQGQSGNYLQYRADIQSNMDRMRIDCVFSDYFTGNCSVISCYGLRDISRDVGGFWFKQAAWRVNVNTALGEYTAVATGLSQAIPFSKRSTRSDSNYEWVYDSVDIWVDPLLFDTADSVTFLISGTYLENFTAYLSEATSDRDEVTVPVHVLEVQNVYTSGVNVYETKTQQWPLNYHEVTIDLSGYDLKDKYVHLSFRAMPIIYERPYECTYWSIEECIFAWNYSEIPWYQIFFSWLKKPLYSIESFAMSTYLKVAEIFNVLKGDNDTGEAIQQAGQAMSEQAGVMNDANAQMDAVDRPDINPDQMFGSMLNFNPGSLRLLSAITAQPNVTAMIVVVFTFALCGYIFFGKRK